MSEATMVFEAERWARRSKVAFAILLALGLIPLMMLLGAGVGVALSRGLGAPIRVQMLAAAGFALPAAYLAWRVVTEQLRFCVALLPDRVEVGRGRSCRRLPYEEVDLIAVPRTTRQRTWVRIRGRGVDAMALVAPEDLEPCVSALIERCPNAIFIDAKGQEHLPKQSRRPLRNLLILERRHWKRAMIYAIAALPMSVIGALSLWVILGHFLGWLPHGVTHYLSPKGVVILIIGGPALAFESSRSFGKARIARMERLDLAATGRFDDES